MKLTKELGHHISLIELFDLGKAMRTGAYVIQGEELTIVETSASPSIPFLLKGLEELKIKPEQVKHIIVTHIHLDHAGGVGLLLKSCPNATVYVHPRGKRHLAQPEKLIAGARAVYGDQFDELFHPILPIPEERLVAKEDGETLKIGSDRILTFWDTPGHAKHHFSIHDSVSNGIFTGDTIGVFYPQLIEQGMELVLPSTSPNQFDPDAMLRSVEKVEALGVDTIYFGHYGKSDNPSDVYSQVRYWLPEFKKAWEEALKENEGESMERQQQGIAAALLKRVKQELAAKSISLQGDVAEIIELDLSVCAMGILDYLAKEKR